MQQNSSVASFGVGLVALCLSIMFIVSVIVFSHAPRKLIEVVDANGNKTYHQLPAFIERDPNATVWEDFPVIKDQSRFLIHKDWKTYEPSEKSKRHW